MLLEGLRVVELSRLIAAPFCGLTLSDWGADVVKVEPPEGDYTRGLAPDISPGESAYFQMLNRGKRAIALDFRADGARDVAARLVSWADVVVESLGDGGAGLGVGYESAREEKPGLIWCSITGLGLAQRGRAIDPTLQARMGMMALTGEPGRPPMRLPVPLVDFMTGMYATQSILAALLAVRGGGEGTLLDCAMVDAAATLASSAGVYALGGSEPLRRMGTENLWYVPAANFEAADGEYVQVMAINESHVRALAGALGHPEWLDDPRFAGNDARVENRAFVHGQIAEAIAGEAASHWADAITRAGGLCERIREIEDAWSDPLLADRGLVAPLAGAEPGGFPIPVASLARAFDDAELPRAPRHGEHSGDVAAELGLDAGEIAALVESGALIAA